MVGSLLALVPAYLMRELIDTAIPRRDRGLLALLGVGMIAAPLFRAGFETVQAWLAARAAQGIVFDLRRNTYRHVQNMPIRFFTHTRLGTLLTRLQSDVVGAQYVITGTFVTTGSNVVMVAAVGTVLFVTEWRLTLLAMAALPLFVFAARWVARLLRRASQDQMEHQAKLAAISSDTMSVGGSLMVRLFDRFEFENSRFSSEAHQIAELGIRRQLIGGWFQAMLGAIAGLGTAGVFVAGGFLVIQGAFTIGTVVMFAALLYQLYSPLSNLSNARVEFATALVSFERVFEVLDMVPDITDTPGALDLETAEGSVEFDDVWFRYPAGPVVEEKSAIKASEWRPGIEAGPTTSAHASERWALQQFSAKADPGQLVALVGPSGAGKTTISYLIPRLYDVTRGRITLDGHDIRSLTLSSLGRHVSMVTQDAYLFNDTIAANLRYARPEATQQEIEAACRNANIHEFIAALPQAYETNVGERGQRLSGGEKQRIGIARALLKDAAILILDEATSHLDSLSERLVQEALERVMVGRTTFVIAHRLSTVRSADLILVLDGGRLAESGTHQQLIERGGLYASLHQLQHFEQDGESDEPPR